MTCGGFSLINLDSLYEIDPRVKLVWLISSMSVYFTDNIFIILAVLLISSSIFLLSRAYKTIYGKGFYYILVIFLLVFMVGTLTSNQTSDIYFISLVLLKWSGMILTSIAFFVITRPFELIDALRGFKLPEGFVFALGISFRFIPVIFEEIEKITLAQKARGLYYGKGFGKLFRLPVAIKALIIPLIVEVLRKTWDIWLALNIRGYVFGKKRRTLRFKLSILNLSFLFYSISITLLSWWV